MQVDGEQHLPATMIWLLTQDQVRDGARAHPSRMIIQAGETLITTMEEAMLAGEILTTIIMVAEGDHPETPTSEGIQEAEDAVVEEAATQEEAGATSVSSAIRRDTCPENVPTKTQEGAVRAEAEVAVVVPERASSAMRRDTWPESARTQETTMAAAEVAVDPKHASNAVKRATCLVNAQTPTQTVAAAVEEAEEDPSHATDASKRATHQETALNQIPEVTEMEVV